MSLFIGNLSPRVSQEELESVFGRFGRCTIKLKGGYGFAVYGIRAQAEVAMRVLRGKNICGLPVSLSWSNKQPSIRQPFNRGDRPYEMQQGRGFVRRDNHMNGPLRPNACSPHKLRHPEGDPRRMNSNDLQDEGGSIGNVHEEQERSSPKEDGQDRADSVDHNRLDSGRWGEKIGRLSNDGRIDDGTTFDRYEPESPVGQNEIIDLEGDNSMLQGISPGKEISEGKSRREEAVDLGLGPRNSTRKNQACFKCGNLGHFMRDCPLQEASRERKSGRFDDRRGSVLNSRDRGKVEEGAEPSSRRRLSSASTKDRARGRKDSGSERRQRLKRRKRSPVSIEYNDHGKARGRRKRSEDGKEYHKGRHGKRIRRSHSRSRSSSASSSRSSSTSRSSVSYSSSSSLSGSKSNKPKSGRAKSRLKSSSSSPTSRSLSVSIGQPPSSPPNKTKKELNGHCDIFKSLPTKPDDIRERQHFEIAAEEEGTGCENTAVDMQSDLVTTKEDNVTSGDMALQDEDMVVCVDGQDDDVNTDNMHKNREEIELQTLGIESCVPMNSDPNTAACARAKNISISLEELDRVIKYYKLKPDEENGGHLSVEDYFGCARLWPWEIVYYRRLKKGSVTVENYARRLAQNREFGIADKYVRSSSGWGEPSQEL